MQTIREKIDHNSVKISWRRRNGENVKTATKPLDEIHQTGYIERERGYAVNMSESSRLIIGLRGKGWTDTEIADFILWIETGEEQYRPTELKSETKREDQE